MVKICFKFLVYLFSLFAPDFLSAQELSWGDNHWTDILNSDKILFGSEKDEKYQINSFFMELENRENFHSYHFFWFLRYRDYPKYRERSVYPFYHSRVSKIDQRERKFIFPLYFHSNYNYNNIYEKTFILPALAFVSFKKEIKEGSLINSIHNIFSPVFMHHKKVVNGKIQRETLLLPFLPIYLSYQNDQMSYSHIFPFYFHYKLNDNNHYFGPVYYHYKSPNLSYWLIGLFGFGRNNEHKRYFNIFPFFYYKENTFLHFAPIYFRLKNDEENSKLIFGPFYYYFRNNTERSGLIFNTWWKINDYDGLTHFYFVPFLFYKQNSYLHFLPFFMYFRSIEKNTFQDSVVKSVYFLNMKLAYRNGKWDQFHFFPFYFHKRNHFFSFFPFYFYMKRANYKYSLIFNVTWIRDTNNNQILGLDVLPFFFYSNKNGTKKYSGPGYRIAKSGLASSNWILNTYWRRNSFGTLKKLIIFPLIFYKQKGYYTLFPIYFSKYSSDKTKRSSFGLFHYSRIDFEKKEKIFHVFPIYYSWKKPNRKGRIVIPFYLNIREEDKFFSFYLFLMSLKISQNPILYTPNEKTSSIRYFDSDVSFFFGLIHVGSKFKLSNPINFLSKSGKEKFKLLKSQALSDISNKQNQTDEEPSFSNDLKIDRKKSKSFFQFSLLWGWTSYARSDSKRHLRVLPFLWFSWSKNSSDKVHLFFPLYASYKKGDKGFKAFFPLGIPVYVKKWNSETKSSSFFGGIFSKKIMKSENKTTYYLPWPLVKITKSDFEKGFRFLPFFSLYETNRENLEVKKRHIYLPFPILTKNTLKRNGEITTNKKYRIFFPYFHFSTTTNSLSKSIESNSFSTFMGLYTKIQNNNRTHLNILGLYNSNQDSNNVSSFLIPIYFYEKTNEKRFLNILGIYTSFQSNNSKMILLLPIYLYDRKKDVKKYTIFPLLTHLEISNEKKYINVMGLFLYTKYFHKPAKSIAIYPFFHFEYDKSVKGQFYSELNVLFLYNKLTDETHGYKRIWIFPFYWKSENTITKQSYKFIVPVYWKKTDEINNSSQTFLMGVYTHKSPIYNRKNYFFLYDYEQNNLNQKKSLRIFFSSFSYHSTQTSVRYSILARSVFGLYKDQNKFYDLNVFWFRYSRNPNFTKHSMLPIYYYSKDLESKRLWITPILTYSSETNQRKFLLGGLGAIIYKNHDRILSINKTLILGGSAFYKIERKERGYKAIGSLWGGLWKLEKEEETGFKKLSILDFVFTSTTVNGKNTRRILGIKI